MYGAFLKPESSYSPISSMPTARRGTVSAAGPGAAAAGVSITRVRWRYSSAMLPPSLPCRSGLVALVDRGLLRRVGIGDRAVREHVRGHCGVHRDRDVCVHQ